MTTALIIVNYNDYESTKHLIDNVKDYKCIDKILIVDNDSNEEEKNKLKKIRCKKVKIIYNNENKGYSFAINVGCRYLINEYGKCNIIVSNSDIIINDEKDIKDLLKILSKKEFGVVAPVIFENNHLNRGWKLCSPKCEILFNIPKLYKKFEKKYRYYSDSYYNEDISYVDVVSGCFFLIKSTVIEKINFLDENVFLYYEENILARKIKNIGLKIAVVNPILIIHNHSVTIDKNVNRIRKYKILKNSQYYYNKEYNGANRLELFLLKITSKFNEIVMKMVCKFKKVQN